MKFIKKTLCLLTVIVMLFTVSACNVKDNIINSISDINSKDNNPGIDEIAYRLPYTRNDSLNPYEAETESNINLATLLFDSLYTVDNSFNPVALIASDSAVNGKTLKVTIKSGLKFTDNSDITANDVVYSFKIAKKSDNYKDYLLNISEASADGESINFTLKHFCSLESANLVFPIIKADSDKASDESSETYSVLPVGSGRYYLDDSENKDEKILRVNKNRLGSYHPVYNLIGLTDVNESTSFYNLFNLSKIDCYTNNFSDGKFTNYTGIGSNKKTTNFVYLGINKNTSSLSDGNVRRAIALSINRIDLAAVSFTSFACASSVPFHPNFAGSKDCTLPTLKCDTKAAIKLLEQAGFKNVSESGIRYSDKKSLEISLLVNKSNSFKLSMARSIQQALSKVDIKVKLNELDYSNYVEAVKNGSYDMYIAEARLSNSFDLERFFTEDGGLDYGIKTKSETADKYLNFRDGKENIQTFIDSFSDSLPIIPIAFRDTLIVKSSKIKTDIVSTPADCFSNIGEWVADNG